MKILIIRLSSIGDIILTTPVLQAFKEKYPYAEIHYLTLNNFENAIKNNPNIDKLILFDKKNNDGFFNLIKFGKELNKNKYNYVFDLHDKFRSKIIRKFITSQIYTYKKRKLWKSLLVNLGLVKYKVDNTIVKNYFETFKKFNLKYTSENLFFYFDKKDIEKIEKYKNNIVFAPWASKHTKEWPIEYYFKLGQLISKIYNCKILIVGGAENIKDSYIFDDQFDFVNLVGKLKLSETAALLSLSRIFVGNDSAPFHISRAVGCKSFVIFGATSPKMFDFGRNEILIYNDEKCGPCSLHGDKKCPHGHFDCMKKIKPEIVAGIIKEKIN